MQKSKRLLCLALAVSILTLATACGGNNTPQTDTSIATTDSTAETTADTGTSDTDMAGEFYRLRNPGQRFHCDHYQGERYHH